MRFRFSRWHANAMEFVFTRSKLAARAENTNLTQTSFKNTQIPSTRASPLARSVLARCTSLCNFQFTLFPFFAFRFCFCFCLLCFISCCCCSCSFAVVLVCEQLDWKLYTINFRSQNCKQAITFFAIVLRNYLSQFWMIDLSICRGN